MRIALAVLALAVSVGCGVTLGPSRTAPTVIYYDVGLSGDLAPKQRAPIAETVALRPFSQSAALDRDGIRYRTSDVEGGYWSYQRWAQSVDSMVRETAARDIAASGLVGRALLLDNAGRAEYLVDAQVHRFEEVDGKDGWFGLVEITFEVVRASDGGIVFHERIRDREKASAENVADVVRALEKALRSVLDEFYEGLAAAVGGGGR
jgi:ABC-type uncharacterized transport system auxiliary subunit